MKRETSVYPDEVTVGAGTGAVVLDNGNRVVDERKKIYDGKFPCTE